MLWRVENDVIFSLDNDSKTKWKSKRLTDMLNDDIAGLKNGTVEYPRAELSFYEDGRLLKDFDFIFFEYDVINANVHQNIVRKYY